jgi:hypothetical protein
MARRIAAAILAIVWATTAIGVAAQTGKLKDTQLNPDRVASSKRAVVIGCVGREGNGPASRYVITDTRPQTPVQYRLDADPDLLRFHVGHLVEIAGSLTATKGGAAGASTVKVEALTYLSTTCTKMR